MIFDSPANRTANRPTTIPYTQRQRVTSRSGVELERAFIYMPSASWEALRRIAFSTNRSGSQVIQSLIAIAELGTQKENNATTTINTD